MKKLLSRGLATAVGMMSPVLALAQYDDYYSDGYYDDYYDYGYEGSEAGLAALGIGMIIFIGFMALVGLALTIFTIWMIIDAARRQFDQKVMWILLMVFLGFIPALIYFFMIKRKNVTGAGTKKPVATGTPPAQS